MTAAGQNTAYTAAYVPAGTRLCVVAIEHSFLRLGLAARNLLYRYFVCCQVRLLLCVCVCAALSFWLRRCGCWFCFEVNCCNGTAALHPSCSTCHRMCANNPSTSTVSAVSRFENSLHSLQAWPNLRHTQSRHIQRELHPNTIAMPGVSQCRCRVHSC